MKIVHRVAFAATPAERRQLDDLGIKRIKVSQMPGGTDPFIAFDIGEDHPKWLELRALLKEWGHSEGNVSTTFTAKELDSARHLQIAAWHHGYPQPNEDEFGYRQATFDLTDFCVSCGIGLRQKAPFQMKAEPKWGRNAMMQLIWVYDELFVAPDIWSRVFEPLGVAGRPVLNRNGVELKTVVQLVVNEVVGIVTQGLTSERCERCGRTKYLPVTRGAFPALPEEPKGPIARTSEYFGSGGQAYQCLLISQAVARALGANQVRGTSLKPVAAKESDPAIPTDLA